MLGPVSGQASRDECELSDGRHRNGSLRGVLYAEPVVLGASAPAGGMGTGARIARACLRSAKSPATITFATCWIRQSRPCLIRRSPRHWRRWNAGRAVWRASVAAHAASYARLNPIYLGDDLFSRQ